MSRTAEVFFDAALPAFVDELAAQFGPEIVEKGVVVRDTSGRLRFLSPELPPLDEARVTIEARLVGVLGEYIRPGYAIAFSDEPGVQTLLNDSAAFPVTR
jgi:hypothetical protein